jgi:hypothetical protein
VYITTNVTNSNLSHSKDKFITVEIYSKSKQTNLFTNVPVSGVLKVLYEYFKTTNGITQEMKHTKIT